MDRNGTSARTFRLDFLNDINHDLDYSTKQQSRTTSTASTSSSTTTAPPPQPSDVVTSLTLTATSGSVTGGIGGTLSSTLIPTITGNSLDRENPSATVSGDPAGISVSFSPGYELGPPFNAYFTMTITVTPAAPAGIYTITADDSLLQAGTDCSGSCVQPTYQLIVEPSSDVVESVSLTPSTGSSPAGVSVVLPVAVTATILGDAPSYLVYAYAVSPDVEGISLSFVPFVESGSPPSGSYVATMTVAASVPPGVYSIIVGEAFLDSGTSCLPTLFSPCAGVFTLTVYPQGPTVTANLQDSVNAGAAITTPANAPLTDSVHVGDTYVAPAVATLSDAVKVIDQYVAPVTASLSDRNPCGGQVRAAGRRLPERRRERRRAPGHLGFPPRRGPRGLRVSGWSRRSWS